MVEDNHSLKKLRNTPQRQKKDINFNSVYAYDRYFISPSTKNKKNNDL